MTTNGTAPFPGWWVEFAANVLRQLPRPGELEQTTAEDWSRNQESLKTKLREVLVAPSSPFLEGMGTVTVLATAEPFVTRSKFVVEGTPINISFLGSNFQKWFAGKTEEPMAEAQIRYANLVKSSVDGPILAELGENVETMLAQIWQLLELQPNGEEGVLLTKGWANIFYVRDVARALRAVRVGWFGDGWSVNANSVGRLGGWRGGDRVFSSNS